MSAEQNTVHRPSSVHTHHSPQLQTQKSQTQADEWTALIAQSMATSGGELLDASGSSATTNPLRSISLWAFEMGLFGVGFGLIAALHKGLSAESMALVPGIVMQSCWAGLVLGVVSGVLGGVTLKTLRGRVPAIIGLGLTSIAVSAPYTAILWADGSWEKLLTIIPLWGIVAAGMIPMVAVRHSRPQHDGRAQGWTGLLPSLCFGICAAGLVWAMKFFLGV